MATLPDCNDSNGSMKSLMLLISFCCGPFGHPTIRGEALKRPQWQFLTWGGVVRQPKGQRHLGVVKKVFCARLWAD